VSDRDARLHELARAILERAPVDWARAESSADPSTRHVIRELRVIAGIEEVHGRQVLSSAGETSPAGYSASDAALGSWGPLRLLEKIGEGAYGDVFRAWDPRLDREVALKLLPLPHALAGRPTSTIIHEGRLLARVRHPNVVTIYGAEQIDDRIGLWMELVRGRTLEQVVKARGPFSAAETARIGLELCRALSAVHGAGLLHRDIKAHNVMLADDGRVVLMAVSCCITSSQAPIRSGARRLQTFAAPTT
jgi:serine/threonine protein kinase